MQATEKNSDPIKVVGTDRAGRRWPVCWLSLLLSLMTAVTAMAQLKSFTLDDLIPGGKTYEDRLPDRLSLVWWGNKLVKAEQGRAYIYNKKKEEWQLLFDKTSAPFSGVIEGYELQFFGRCGDCLAIETK